MVRAAQGRVTPKLPVSQRWEPPLACPLNSISGTPNRPYSTETISGSTLRGIRARSGAGDHCQTEHHADHHLVRILYISGAAATVCLGVADATLTAATNEGVCRYVRRYDRRRQTWIIVARYARKGRSGLKRPDGLATCPSECRQNHCQHRQTHAAKRLGQHPNLHRIGDRFDWTICVLRRLEQQHGWG
jgi:hypothetical protein